MTENEKQKVGIFRFSVIHEFVGGAALSRKEKRELLKEKCARKWDIPFSDRSRISRSAILRWIRLYTESGNRLESLYPKDRSDNGKSRTIDEETGLNLIRLRQEMPDATVPVLIRMMKDRDLSDKNLRPTTVYRFLHNHNLMKPQVGQPDRRKFEAELPNDMWQSDVMHGPMVMVGDRKRKSYLIAFIDDHSRLIPYARFYLSENLASFLDAFEKSLLKRGLPRKLYVDNGAAYRSKQLEHITASLGIALIHARPYKPQGKGKIERFFRTVRMQFLSETDPMSLDELNGAFDLWIREVYHQRVHSGTGKTPLDRFTSQMECLRASPEDLRDHFRMIARRKVAKDRTLTLEGHLFEAPVTLIGQRVDLLYHKGHPKRVEVRWQQKSYGYLTLVDLNVNCRVKRDKKNQAQISASRHQPVGGKVW
ncbi:MAG: DDE-type integrase/transposase/recombinase [Deltaproteobacteria bacterium]|nr:DDE-type integrase/transposase/recombinase [Deltaproteobacteria bacterium]